MKEKVEAIDKDNFVYNYIMNKPEKITYETKLELSPSGGSICKTTSKYYTIDDFEVTEERIKTGKKNP
ncbi:hypothetical protein PTKIN_Ptkin17bG0111600 [Pterospermum kingtungense]